MLNLSIEILSHSCVKGFSVIIFKSRISTTLNITPSALSPDHQECLADIWRWPCDLLRSYLRACVSRFNLAVQLPVLIERTRISDCVLVV